MKHATYTLFLAALLCVGCDKFFNTNPKDIYNAEDYIGTQSEIYSGFLGVITKMQAVGDHAIFLTDTRADYLEPTDNAPQELREVYSYEHRQGNAYADPRGFYDVIISCNDYMQKARAYRDANPEVVDADHYRGLVSSALRVKAWAYFMLAKIYGQAIYFDEPLTEYKSMNDYPILDLDQLIAKCKQLLEVGVDGIDGSYVINWAAIINPSDPNNASLIHWGFMTPDYAGLLGEICLWTGDYQKTIDLVWPALNAAFAKTSEQWSLSDWWRGKYAAMFSDVISTQSKFIISAIIYNYDNNQTNRLIDYFENVYPCKYYLRPSEYGVERYRLQPRSDGTEGDTRRGGRLTSTRNGERVMRRFLDESVRPAYRNDVHINIFRPHDYHLMLIEAFNHVKHWDEAESIMNRGVGQRWGGQAIMWDVYGGDATWGSNWSGSKPNLGVRYANDLDSYDLPRYDDLSVTDDEKIRAYDEAILNEILLEFPCEGKVYPAMIRFARRYGNDYAHFIADKIVPKYPEAMQATVRAKILAGEYFVKWDLRTE
ncbi:MAG: RagB/SusD family nutrient uptake outer membrane protein [Odoribacteraceae bacterium]|jgi:hypothetical protein|nr:RagB/SusD family nutrient uptake outer membrane protein [Odoribacteraceae bacterium]